MPPCRPRLCCSLCGGPAPSSGPWGPSAGSGLGGLWGPPANAAPGTSRPAVRVPVPSAPGDCQCCQLPGLGRPGSGCGAPRCPALPSFLPPAPPSSAAPSTALVLGDSLSLVPGPYLPVLGGAAAGAPGCRPLWGALAGPSGCHWSAPEGRGCRQLPAPALTFLLALCGPGRTRGGGPSSTGPAHPWGTLLFETSLAPLPLAEVTVVLLASGCTGVPTAGSPGLPCPQAGFEGGECAAGGRDVPAAWPGPLAGPQQTQSGLAGGVGH